MVLPLRYPLNVGLSRFIYITQLSHHRDCRSQHRLGVMRSVNTILTIFFFKDEPCLSICFFGHQLFGMTFVDAMMSFNMAKRCIAKTDLMINERSQKRIMPFEIIDWTQLFVIQLVVINMKILNQTKVHITVPVGTEGFPSQKTGNAESVSMLWRHMCSTDLQATSGSSMKVLWIHWTMEFFLHALVTAGPTAACGNTKKHSSGNHIQGYQMWSTDFYNVQRLVMESSKDKSPFDKLATRATSASENKAWWQYWSWCDVLASDALYVIHYCDDIWPSWHLKSTGTRLFYQKDKLI